MLDLPVDTPSSRRQSQRAGVPSPPVKCHRPSRPPPLLQATRPPSDATPPPPSLVSGLRLRWVPRPHPARRPPTHLPRQSSPMATPLLSVRVSARRMAHRPHAPTGHRLPSLLAHRPPFNLGRLGLTPTPPSPSMVRLSHPLLRPLSLPRPPPHTALPAPAAARPSSMPSPSVERARGSMPPGPRRSRPPTNSQARSIRSLTPKSRPNDTSTHSLPLEIRLPNDSPLAFHIPQGMAPTPFLRRTRQTRCPSPRHRRCQEVPSWWRRRAQARGHHLSRRPPARRRGR